MSELPRLVQRAPAFFYGAAVLYFVGYLVLTHLQSEQAGGVWDSFTKLALLSAWLQAFEGAVYLIANGVVVHVLLAIWRNGRGADAGGRE